MQISNSFNSHPKKSYNFHVKNISDSFDESDHKETASFHDIAKIAQRFQDYINLEVENFASKEDFEKAQQKLKTTHTLESAFIYFFIRVDKDINFDKSHIKGKKVRLAKNAARIAIWMIFVSI